MFQQEIEMLLQQNHHQPHQQSIHVKPERPPQGQFAYKRKKVISVINYHYYRYTILHH